MPPAGPRAGALGARLAATALSVTLACASAPPSAAPAASPRADSPAPAPPTPPTARYGREPDVALTPEEHAILDGLRPGLRMAGKPARISPSLVAAARALALRAAGGAADPIGADARRAALADAGAADPAPAVWLVHGPRERLPALVAEAVGDWEATHAGAGVAVAGEGAVAVVLGSRRKARLDPFPREVAPGGRPAVLSGALAAGLLHPRVYVTTPGGEVREVDATGQGGAFRAALSFPARGRWVVEVVGTGAAGPEVAALLVVSAGGEGGDAAAPRARAAEPEDRAAAEAAVVAALNGLRKRRGLAPVRPSPELAAVARAHAEAMRSAGRIAHVLPGSGDLGDRLRRAGVAYRRAYENVARAGSSLDAHAAAEESPVHLANMLQAGATLVGVGVARGRLPSGDPSVYLTEILIEPAEDPDASRLPPDVRAREALWAERVRLGRPALTADPALEALAAVEASALRARDATDAGDLGDRALRLGPSRTLAAVDVFVAGDPAEVVRSANLRDARFRRVGLAVAQGDSRRFGAGRLWVVVVYTD